MASKVYFTDMRTHGDKCLQDKLVKLMRAAGFDSIDFKDHYAAIKMHFGELGNLAFLRPNWAKTVVDEVKRNGGKAFLTDCNTLYSGGRSNGVDHLFAASANGYNLLQVNAPVVIADGIKGTEYVEMPVEGGEYCSSAKIGAAVANADVIVSMSHFKGHEMTGFGGALKNLGMGAASVGGKLFLHSEAQPEIAEKECVCCRACEKHCAHDAIHVDKEVRHSAVIDYTKCVGCGQCVAVCQFDAARVVHNSSSKVINYKIAEYTKAILADKPHFHIAMIMDVSPECDCWGSNDAAIVPNIGMACSTDPVALDMACADLVMGAPAIQGTMYTDKYKSYVKSTPDQYSCNCNGENDKFFYMHPSTDWKSGLLHAEKIGLGSTEYELITIK